MSAAKPGVLVVIAHPDDEIFASGTLCLCADRGFPAEIVCVTDGEGGGDAIIRQDELRQSAAALGAGAVSFLHQPDVADPFAPVPKGWDQEQLTGMLAQAIDRTGAALILTHGRLGGYGHPAHRLTHQCVMRAARAVNFDGSIFAFCGKTPRAFFSWHLDEPSTLRIDARNFLERRVASLSAHKSQAPYFLQPFFPRTLRKRLSALFGYAFAWTEAGRKRVPIATPERFFARAPVEGLVLLQAPANGAPHFFEQHFGDDDRVQIDR